MLLQDEKGLVKIAMADDHAMFREALCNMIDSWEDCKVIIRAGNGRQLVERLNPRNLPDLVITDLQMPEMNGYDAIKSINLRHPEIKILAISQYQSEELVWQLIKCGAHGFVFKNDPPERLKKAIYEVLNYDYFFTDHTASKMVKKAMQTGQLTIQNDLSDEEIHFLRLICMEKSYKEIADQMKISERHTEYLRTTLFDRFSVKTRTGMAMIAIQKGLAF